MPTKLSPLAYNVPIVDKDGNPTDYFQRMLSTWLEEKKLDESNLETVQDEVDAVEADLDALEDTVANLELDDLTDVDVSTTPPEDGQALIWDDANSEWIPGDVAATDWTDLTFTTSSTKWSGGAWFASTETLTLGQNDKIEIVLQCSRAATKFMGLAISPDTDNCYMSIIQNDNNWVLYSFDTSGGGSTVLSGGVVNQVETGNHEIRMIIHMGASGSNDRLISIANTIDLKSIRTANTNLRVSTNKIYIRVPDDSLSNIIHCKYRINSPEGR